MRNEHALLAIYHPYAVPAGLVIPDDVQDFIRDRMESAARKAGAAPKVMRRPSFQAAPKLHDEAEICRMTRDGMTVRQISNHLQISQNSIFDILRRCGVKPASLPRFSTKVETIRLHGEGLDNGEIARALGIRDDTVARTLREAGLKFNRRRKKLTMPAGLGHRGEEAA